MRVMRAGAERFYRYQQERFPIVVLIFSLFPAVLSSGAILTENLTALPVALALIGSLAYLLHIRVIDEYRDFTHDTLHHATRPVQSGVISKRELRYADIAAVVLLMIVAMVAGTGALVMALVMVLYAYLAGKEFFIRENIRRHFFLYNGANLVQMLLLQLFVYAVFANPFPFTALLWRHFLFITVGTIIFEFVRKLKRPEDDGTGKDTYTHYLGFPNALLVYELLLVAEIILFFWVAASLSPHTTVLALLSVGLGGGASLATLVHGVHKTHRTDQLLQLSFLMVYGIAHLTLYFLAR